jgi:hypothetical protein
MRTMLQAAGTGFNRAIFERNYLFYYFPLLTQTSPEALKNLGEERQRFFNQHLEACAKNKEIHNLLVGLTLLQMQKIVTDNFHPAVRYNAMLIISGLNEVEMSRFSPPTTPEPLPRALPIIFTEFQRPNNSDAIKIAALLGLSRHLEWENYRNDGSTTPPIQPNLRKAIIDELVKLAQMKDPPQGRDAAGHVWFRRRAVEALGNACNKNADPAIASALDALLRDEKEPVLLRLTVATTLGNMTVKAPATVDAKATAIELGYLALVACDAELSRVSNLRKTEEEHFIRLSGQVPLDPSQQPGGYQGPRANIYGGGGSPDGGYGGMGSGYPGGAYPGGYPGGAYPGGYPSAMAPGSGGRLPLGGEGTTDGTNPEFIDPNLMDPKGYRFDPVRKRLRQNLYCVQLGLLGGEDYVPPKTTTTTTTTTKAAPPQTGPTPPPPFNSNFGIRAATKNAEEKAFVEDVYSKVRKLADIVENRSLDLVQLDRDLRREMRNLEAVTRKLGGQAAAAAAAAEAAAADDDLLAPAGARPAAAAPMPPSAPAPATEEAPTPPASATPTPPAARPAPTPTPPAGKATAPAPPPPAGKAAAPTP